MEFGAKVSVSLVQGFSFVEKIGWDAYNESCDLIEQKEKNTTDCHHHFICIKCGKEEDKYTHDFKKIGSRTTRSTRTWDEYEYTFKCSICGKEVKDYSEEVVTGVLENIQALALVEKTQPGMCILISSHCFNCVGEDESSVVRFKLARLIMGNPPAR